MESTLLRKMVPIAIKSHQKMSHSCATYIFIYCTDDFLARKTKQNKTIKVQLDPDRKRWQDNHWNCTSLLPVKPWCEYQRTKHVAHADDSAVSFCIWLIWKSSRRPADSHVWNGKQPVVSQSPSVWRLEAACWPLFNVNTVLHTAGWWIFHHKCHSSSQMTLAP